MLQINIVNGYPNGTLDLEYKGSTCAGDCCTDQGWRVHWKVKPKDKPDIKVESISDIQMKTGPGVPANTNIFTRTNPPHPHQGDHKHWKAKVKGDAPICAEYHYTIYWKDSDGNDYEYDPKISVMPSDRFNLMKLIVMISTAVLALLFSLNFLRKHKNRE